MVVEEREEQAVRLTKEVEAKLAERFGEGEEKHRSGGFGKDLTYIDVRTVIDRLDDVVGPENWEDVYRILYASEPKIKTVTKTDRNGKSYDVDVPYQHVAVECRLTVCGITKADVGQGLEEGEVFKSAYSDALKRVAVKFGIGRYLYQDTAPSQWNNGNGGGGGQASRYSGNGGGGGGAKPQSESQFNFIVKLAEGLGLSTMDLDNEASAKFNVAGVKALNSFQSSKYIDDLKNRGGGNGGGGNQRRNNDDEDFGQGYDDF